MSLYSTYMEYTAPFKGSVRFHRWACISMIAGMLERRVWLPLGGLKPIYPNMYIVLCGGPGTGKSTVSTLSCEFIKDYNKSLGQTNGGIKFGPDKTTPAALIQRIKKCAKTIKGIPGRGDVVQSAMYIHSTELATFIKDIGGGSISDDLLKLYDCDDTFEKEIVKDLQPTIIVNPCLNFISDTTPAFLSRFMPKEESGTGLTARMIFATELGEVNMDEEVPEGNSVLRARIEKELQRVHRMAGAFKIDFAAKAFWSEWFPEYRKQLFTKSDGSFIRDFYARKPTHLRKLAMIFSASRDSSRIILLEDYKNALAHLDEAEPAMAQSFGVKGYRDAPDIAKRILAAISAEEYTPKDVIITLLYQGGIAGGINEFNNIINTLVEGNMIRPREQDGSLSYIKLI